VSLLSARVALQSGDGLALERGQESLDMFRRLGAMRREAQAWELIARAQAAKRQWGEAHASFATAVERHRIRGDRYGVALARLGHAWMVVQAAEMGTELDDAIAVCREAVTCCSELGACQSEASAMAAWATLLPQTRAREALATLEEAERVARHAAPRGSLALLDVLMARTKLELRRDRQRAQVVFTSLLREASEFDSRAPAIRVKLEALRAQLGPSGIEP
jgi:hypothetical protein